MMISRPARIAPVLLGAFLLASAAQGQSEFVVPTREEAALVNERSIGVVFTHEELFHQLVHNLENALEPTADLRIVPVMGKNHVQSVYDLLYLKGIDLALVRADALEYVAREGDMPSVGRITRSVAKLSDEKIIVIASTDYDSVTALDGQVVGFGVPGSGEFVTASVVFDTLGIEPVPIEIDEISAIDRVKSGELAAMVYLLRDPDAVQNARDVKTKEAVLALDGSEELHVLELPETDALSSIYQPATLGHDELPLVPEGETVPTYSVDLILAAYNWREENPRKEKQRRFVAALVAGLDTLRGGDYQPAWKRVDMTRETPNVVTSPLVAEALEAREAERLQRAEAARQAGERATDETRAEKAAELARRRDALAERLDEELDAADAAELERMLERLDSLLEEDALETGTDTATAETD